MEVGAVAAMRYVKDGIKAAMLVMKHTKHTLLAGEKASEFAISMGLPGPANLSSTESINKWAEWKDNRCQPNFRKNVLPINNCGPYQPTNSFELPEEMCSGNAHMQDINSYIPHVGLHSHDTISMAVIDKVILLQSFFFPIFVYKKASMQMMLICGLDGAYCCWNINKWGNLQDSWKVSLPYEC